MPQSTLTSQEMASLPIGNQHTSHPTLIEWQCVKGAAIESGVRDWLAQVDRTLTYEENVTLMQKKGTKGDEGRTMRELKPVLE